MIWNEDRENSLRIDPEPTPEELVAIIEVLRALQVSDDQAAGTRQETESRWARTARRESLRASDWPVQRQSWETGT